MDATFFAQVIVFFVAIPVVLMPMAFLFWLVKKLWSK